MKYTPWVVSEHVVDYSTLENLVRDPRFAGKAGEGLAVALWGLIVDRDLGIFHYTPAQEPLWRYDLYDPLQVLNVYGFTICHVHANLLAVLFRRAGFEKVRVAEVKGHEGTEVFYDGRWHYFDADIQMYYRLRPPEDPVIASREDLFRDSSLVTDQPNPSFPYHLPDCPPERMRAAYEVTPTYHTDVLEECLHSMDFRLRPGEEMVRGFHHRGRWVVFENYPRKFAEHLPGNGPEGPTERFWPRRQWGNGYFRYAPRLGRDYRDLELGADEVAGCALRNDGLYCEGERGHAVFAFESPYIYCGVPDPMRRLPSMDGAVLKAAFDLPPGSAAAVLGRTERSPQWQPLWTSQGRGGPVDCSLDFTWLTDAAYSAELRFELTGKGAALRSLETRLWFMVSPHSLPALRNAGPNRMRFHTGDKYGLSTRVMQFRHHCDSPDTVEGALRSDNLRHEPGSRQRLFPKDPARPWELVYEVEAPHQEKLAWVAAYALLEGRRPEEAPNGIPATIAVADNPDGPWRVIAERETWEHPQGWHFGLHGEGRFSGSSSRGYVKFSATKGALGFRIAAHYVPAAPPIEEVPLEVEHVWHEVDPRVGRRERRHVERIMGPSHAYVVTCAREPHDDSILMRVPSVIRARNGREGDGDGTDDCGVPPASVGTRSL